jgi:hypothetical protein
MALRVTGAMTPFFGTDIARLILGWWADGGAIVVRAWAFGSVLIGAFIVLAVRPLRPASARVA